MFRVIVLLLPLSFLFKVSSAQERTYVDANSITEALYEGGRLGFLNDFQSAAHFPQHLREEGISGTVYFEARIDEKGVIASMEVVRSLHPELDEITLNAFAQTNGKWKVLIGEDGKPQEYFVWEKLDFTTK